MDLGLQDRVYVVTGGSRGLGYATAEALVADGARVVVAARSQDVAVAANQVIAALTARFGGRGGGRPDLAQAGGLDAPAEAILESARPLIAPST